MVENCVRGFNSYMFAYGQTGGGKTHTMLGDIEDAEQKRSANRGMTPGVFEHLFTRIHKIYNEQVADLLEPSSTNLQWECQSVTHHRFGRLNLVDLAGLERQKSSGAEGECLKEATNINESLSTLGY